MALLNEVDGFPATSVESSPSIPPESDARTLAKLKAVQLLSSRVNNEYLKMKPEDIPLTSRIFSGSKFFYVDDLCILIDDKMDTTGGGCWKKLSNERGQGWGIAGIAGWDGWGRTFVYKPSQPCDSNKTWYLKVYAAIEDDGYVKPLYKCRVFNYYNFDPRPKCVSQVSHAAVDTIQADPVEVESLAKQLEAIATTPNLLPYLEGHHKAFFWLPSIGVDKSLRAEIWKSGKFSRIKARYRDGSEITWSLCNHCGMVYKGTTLPATLQNHKCDCSCRLAPNS